MIKSKKILVTGGLGLVGSHLVDKLAENNSVIVFDNVSSGRKENVDEKKVRIIEGDIADKRDLEKARGNSFDFLLHLAAQANVPYSVENPRKDFVSNTAGTFNALSFAREEGIKRTVFFSSAAVYDKVNRMPIRETGKIKASSPYGASKIAGEAYCNAFTECYGLDVVIARLFNIYGERMRKYVIYDLTKKILRDRGQLEILGDGEQVRDYLYASDAVDALILIAEKGEKGEVYNVGSGIPIKIKDLAKMIMTILGAEDAKIRYTNKSWKGDIKKWYADISRISNMGFKQRVPFETGLKTTVYEIRRKGL